MRLQNATYYLALPFIALIYGTITSIPGLGSIARIAVLPMLVSWLVGIRYGRGVRRLHPYHWTVFAFVLWNVLSFFWALSSEAWAENVSRYVPVIVLSIVLWDVCRERWQIIGALQAFVIGGYIICLSTAYGYFTSSSQANYDGRFAGVGFNPDDFAYLLPVSIAWELSIRSDIRSKLLRAINMAYPVFAILTLVMTAGRGSVIVAVPVYLCVVMRLKRAPASIRMGIVAAFVAGIFLLASGQFSSSLSRLTSVKGSSDAATFNGRTYLWSAAFDLMGKHPLQGIGSGCFHTVSSFYPGVEYMEDGLPAHNTYLSVFSELGAIGFCLYLIAVASALLAASQTEPGYRAAHITAVLSYLIGSSALTYETHAQEWLLFILIVSHSGIARAIPARHLWPRTEPQGLLLPGDPVVSGSPAGAGATE